MIPFLLGYQAFCQCTPQKGPPPSNLIFNSGGNGHGGTLPPAATDLNWTVATDSIDGTYSPAVVMDSLPPDYYSSPWPDCRWISINQSGKHIGKRNFYYKMNFDLPCTNLCGISYNNNNTFCLSLDLFADNSIYEIYVNGIPQSGNLGNIIPILPDPYHAVGLSGTGKLTVSLCRNWKAGPNTIIVEVASSAPVTGLLAQASTIFRHPVSNFIVATICQGEAYHFGTRDLTHAGYAFDSFHTASGCDSNVILDLLVRPAASLAIDQSVCKGESFLGYTATGVYTDTFPAANGCDSLRILHLTVLEKPVPDLGLVTDFCKGDSLILSPGKFLTYLWQDSSAGEQFIVRSPGLYSVTVTNNCGATKDEIAIKEKDCYAYFPNAFTPNHDGKNDVFRILTDYQIRDYHLAIYNQWGQKVFDTTDPLTGWDGNYHGKPQDPAVFVWDCRYRKSNITNHLKGSVTLIRP